MTKRLCSCGCGANVTPMTELRHRNGQATPHVKALQAARRSLISSAPKRGADEPEMPPERQKRL